MSTPSVGPAAAGAEKPPPVTAVGRGSGAVGAGGGAATATVNRAEAGPPRVVRPPRRAPRITTLQLRRIDPWTTLKVSLIVAIVMFFIWMIAVGLLYALFSSLDVVSRINDGWATVTNVNVTTGEKDVLITPGRVFGIASVVGAINIVVLTAISTVFAFVYNASAGMAGGVELTLGERD
jgi:hypothetical protein